MKNILDTAPSTYEELHGRLRFSCDFVKPENLKDRDVLDIGCGFGWFELFALRQNVRSIHGIEYSQADLQTALKHVHDPRSHFSVGTAISLPFPDQSFDTVVSWEVIEHIPKETEAKMFQEVRRVLRPGGVFYMSTPSAALSSRVLDPAWWLIGHRHYHEKDLKKFAQEAGFKGATLFQQGGWWEIASWWNLYIAKWIFRRSPFCGALFDGRIDQEFPMKVGNGFVNVFAKFTM